MHPVLGWALGTQGKLGQVLLLQAGGGQDGYTLEDSTGTHAMMKEKPRGQVGAHRGGQSSLRSDEGFLRNQCLGVSQMKRRKGHRRENSVCRAQWYDAVLSVSVIEQMH